MRNTLEDAQRAIRLIRYRAAHGHIDPHKIGVLGSSAGGHLVAAIGTHFSAKLYRPGYAVDGVSNALTYDAVTQSRGAVEMNIYANGGYGCWLQRTVLK